MFHNNSSLSHSLPFPQCCVPSDEKEKIDFLRLIRSDNVGPITFIRLLCNFRSVTKALEALPELSKKGGNSKKYKVCSQIDAIQEMESGLKVGATLSFIGDKLYPSQLFHIYSPPIVLWVKGYTDILQHEPLIAIVGSRNSSAISGKFAFQIAGELVENGCRIVSGMARGIDSSAHWGAINHGTIAVLAGGVDFIYPPENTKLYHEIQEHGAIVSEMPIGMKVHQRHFPRRNRIISGLSHGLLVIEASEKSGSLITAQYALEQGREVMTVPGHPLDPRAGGCNQMIREGATLIRSASDIMEVIDSSRTADLIPENHLFDNSAHEWSNDLPAIDTNSKEHQQLRDKILSLCNYTPVEIDEIIRILQIPARLANTLILELNLAGNIIYISKSKVALKD